MPIISELCQVEGSKMTKQNILATLLFASFLCIQGCQKNNTSVVTDNNEGGGYYDENGIYYEYEQTNDEQPQDNYTDNVANDDVANVIPQLPQLPQENPNVIELEAIGIGVAPSESCSPAQAVALAKRAAIVDAYRQLGEQMYGVQVTATDDVRNMMLKNSSVKTKINAVIRGAQVKDSSCQKGVCQVNIELKLDRRIWSQIFGI